MEIGFVRLIDDAYSGNKDVVEEVVINELLKEAYHILNDAPEWQVKHKELYEALEQVVVLGAREKVFKDHFDQIEDTVTSALQLDFSKRAPFTKVTESKRNIINYASMTLNMVIEKLETSVVSRKAVDSVISILPDTAVIVTDDAFSIRFVNNYIENLLKTEYEQLIGKPLMEMIREPEPLIDKLLKRGKIDNTVVELLVNKNKERYVKMYLNVPSMIDEKNEVKEHVFILSKEPAEKEDRDFDLKLEAHDKIAPINSIIGAANYIARSYKGDDEKIKWLAESIQENAWQIKEQAQGTLLSIAQGLPDGYEPVNFQAIVNQIFKLIGYSGEDEKLQIDVNLNVKGTFFSIPRLIRSILQNLISNSIKYSKPHFKSQISIEINNWKDKGISITVTDNGIGIPEEKQRLIYDINYRASKEAEGYGNGLYLVAQIVDKLKGTITLNSKEGTGATFTVQLPHYQ